MSKTTINIDDVQQGMVLAANVSTDSGRVLLTAGSALSERHIQLLAANGVTQVEVGGPLPTAAATQPLSEDQIDTHLRQRFEHNEEGHPLIDELRRICRQRLTGTDEGGTEDEDGTG